MTESDAEKRILLDALVSYADACTLPLLTPTCPFYSTESGRATCNEECRDIATSRGAEPRLVRTQALGGLVMRGRELPTRSVAGASMFDAHELFQQEKEKELAEWSTAALLVGLEESLRDAVVLNDGSGDEDTLMVWGELVRRGMNMERVSRGGLTNRMAASVGARMMFLLLERAGLTAHAWQGEAEEEEQVTGAEQQWLTLLEASALHWTRGERSARGNRDQTVSTVRELWAPLLGPEVTDTQIEEFLASTPAYAHSMSRDFSRRAATWFDHLFENDLVKAVSGAAPESDAMFTALPLHVDDVEGRWIWERFTETDLHDWSATSLVQEWRLDPETFELLCPERVMNERVIDQSHAGERALATLSETRPKSRRFGGIVPSLFTTQAAQALRNGDWERAARIFAGVVELRPADAEAWNNLGFCQMGGPDLHIALASLERAAELPRGGSVVCFANRALTLHLLGRDEEAMALTDRFKFLKADVDSLGALLWAHPSDEGAELELQDRVGIVAYILELRDHMAEESCLVGAGIAPS